MGIKATKAPYDWCCPDCQELDCECDPPRPKAHTKPVEGCMGCDFIVILTDDQRGYCHEHGDINGGVDADEEY